MVSIIVTLQKCLCLSIKSSRVPSAFLFSALCDVRECVMSESVYHLQHMGLSLSGEAPPTFCLPRSANQKNVCKKQESEGRIKTNHFFSVTHANTVRDER